MKYSISLLFAILCAAGKPAAYYNNFTNSKRHPIAVADSSLPFYSPVQKAGKFAQYYRSRRTGIIGLPSLFSVSDGLNPAMSVKGAVGLSNQGRLIEAYYFPGASAKRALVLGGVHGSELSSVAVAKALLQQLENGMPSYYSVLVIPALFPDNLASALDSPIEIGSTNNIGRYTSPRSADPNRQMPSLGKPYDRDRPFDHFGRHIESENKLLLECIERFRPDRIVNIHAIRNQDKAGIYADPRTDHNGYALGYATDSSLAVDMAKYIEGLGGRVPANRLKGSPTALYVNDPPIAPKGECQKRNLLGSCLPGSRGHGVSLGAWASTAVYDPQHPERSRPPIRLITVEFPGNKRPVDYTDSTQQVECGKQVGLYAAAIREVFLAKRFEEENYIHKVALGDSGPRAHRFLSSASK